MNSIFHSENDHIVTGTTSKEKQSTKSTGEKNQFPTITVRPMHKNNHKQTKEIFRMDSTRNYLAKTQNIPGRSIMVMEITKETHASKKRKTGVKPPPPAAEDTHRQIAEQSKIRPK